MTFGGGKVIRMEWVSHVKDLECMDLVITIDP